MDRTTLKLANQWHSIINRTSNVLRWQTISNCTESWYSLPGDILNGPLLKKDTRVTGIRRSNVSGGTSELTVPTVSKQQHLDAHRDTVAPQRLHLFLYASCSLTLAVTHNTTQHNTTLQINCNSKFQQAAIYHVHLYENITQENSPLILILTKKRKQCFPKPCRSTGQLWSPFPCLQLSASHQLTLQDHIMYMGPVHQVLAGARLLNRTTSRSTLRCFYSVNQGLPVIACCLLS